MDTATEQRIRDAGRQPVLADARHLMPGLAMRERARTRAADRETIEGRNWQVPGDAELDWLRSVGGASGPNGDALASVRIFSIPPRLCRELAALEVEAREECGHDPAAGARQAAVARLVDFFGFIEAPIAGNHSVTITRLGTAPLSGHPVSPGAHVNLGSEPIGLECSSLCIPDLGRRELRVVLRAGEGVFFQGDGTAWRLQALEPRGAQLLSVLPA